MRLRGFSSVAKRVGHGHESGEVTTDNISLFVIPEEENQCDSWVRSLSTCSVDTSKRSCRNGTTMAATSKESMQVSVIDKSIEAGVGGTRKVEVEVDLSALVLVLKRERSTPCGGEGVLLLEMDILNLSLSNNC